jgi:hypothetical protein
VNLTGTPTFGFYIDYATGGTLLGRAKVAKLLSVSTSPPLSRHGRLPTRAKFEQWRGDVDAIMARIRALNRKASRRTTSRKPWSASSGGKPAGARLPRRSSDDEGAGPLNESAK